MKNNILNIMQNNPLFLLWVFKFLSLFKTKVPVYIEDNNDLIFINDNDDHSKEIPKIIWLFWNEEKLPLHIQIYVNRLKKLNKGYIINVLGYHNLHNYLKFYNFQNDTPIANQTDLIRLDLLYKYGGVWIDISTIFNVGLDKIFPILNGENKYDLLAFYNKTSTTNYNSPIIESWFLAAPKNNEFIKQWLKEFKKIEYIGSKRMFLKIKERHDYEEIKQKISDPEYLLIYLTQQIVLKNNNYNLYLKKCEDSAFFYQNHFGWKPLKMHNLLINYDINELDTMPPLIKLVSGDRKLLPILINKKYFKKNSIIANLVQE